MILTSFLLRRRRIAGLVMAVPLLVFGAVMGVAIIAMSRVMAARGLPGLGGVEFVMATMVGASVWLTCAFLRHVRAADNPAA